jgi:flagellar biosynthesis GTPase FlhF
MKRLILCLSILIVAAGIFAQTNTEKSPAQKATDELVQVYSLDANQAAAMLKIQQREYRNLSEIEPVKESNPPLYIQKIRALQYAQEVSFRKLLNEEQMQIFIQKIRQLRERKAQVYKEMKAAGASQEDIDKKVIELDVEALQ